MKWFATIFACSFLALVIYLILRFIYLPVVEIRPGWDAWKIERKSYKLGDFGWIDDGSLKR